MYNTSDHAITTMLVYLSTLLIIQAGVRKALGYLPVVILYTEYIDDYCIAGYGWAGTYYFMDPENGIALMFGSQLLPPKDLEAYKVWEKAERSIIVV